MTKEKNRIWATGRRKTAVASVRMTPGAGKFEINRHGEESGI